MRKIFAALILCAMALSVFSCGEAEKPASGNETDEVITEASDATDAVEETQPAETEPETEAVTEAKPAVHKYYCPMNTLENQGEDGWYYYSRRGDAYTDMEYRDDGSWHGECQYNLVMASGVHPDEAETVIMFKAPVKGNAKLEFAFNVDSENSNGVKFQLVKNKENVIYPAEGDYYLIEGGSDIEEAVEMAVEEGDEFFFVFNINGNSGYDSTGCDITVTITEELPAA